MDRLMPEKTDNKFRLPVLILATVLAGTLLIFLGNYLRDYSYGQKIIRVTNAVSIPALEVHKMNVVNNISEFGGKENDRERNYFSFAVTAGGTLLLLVISPFLLINFYSSPGTKGAIGWYAGAVIILLGIYASATVIVNTISAGTENAEIINQNREKDRLRTQLASLAFEAAEVAILPAEFGGGNGSFRNFPGGSEKSPREIRLSDLSAYQASAETFQFEITGEVSDSALVISGWRDPAPDEKVVVKVTPHDDEVFRYIKN